MARLLLDELQYRMLDILVREGGATLGTLYLRLNAERGADIGAVLRAAQALYDFSFVDVKRYALPSGLAAERRDVREADWPKDPRVRYVDDMTPEQLRLAYRHLDEFTLGSVLARGNPTDDPYYFAASHLAPGEHARPGYAQRAAAGGVPAGELPPLDIAES